MRREKGEEGGVLGKWREDMTYKTFKQPFPRSRATRHNIPNLILQLRELEAFLDFRGRHCYNQKHVSLSSFALHFYFPALGQGGKCVGTWKCRGRPTTRDILLICKHEQQRLFHFSIQDDAMEFLPRFIDAGAVVGVDDEDETLCSCIVTAQVSISLLLVHQSRNIRSRMTEGVKRERRGRVKVPEK